MNEFNRNSNTNESVLVCNSDQFEVTKPLYLVKKVHAMFTD